RRRRDERRCRRIPRLAERRPRLCRPYPHVARGRRPEEAHGRGGARAFRRLRHPDHDPAARRAVSEAAREAMRRALPAVLVAPVVAGVVFVGLFVGRWLSVTDSVRPVDAVVVTSGDIDRRVPAAVDLVNRGESHSVFVALSERAAIIGEEARIRDYIKRETTGREPAVTFLSPSRSVLGQATALRHNLSRTHQRASRVGVLAAPWQAARVHLAFERSLVRTDVLVWSDGSPYNARRWWRTARSTTLVEAMKTGATLALLGPLPNARGQRAPARSSSRRWPVPCAGALRTGSAWSRSRDCGARTRRRHRCSGAWPSCSASAPADSRPAAFGSARSVRWPPRVSSCSGSSGSSTTSPGSARGRGWPGPRWPGRARGCSACAWTCSATPRGPSSWTARSRSCGSSGSRTL